MTNAQSTAYRVRWVLLGAGLLCWLAGLFYLINVAWPHWKVLPINDEENGAGLMGVMGWWTDKQSAYWVSVGVYFGAFVITQWLLLCPRGRLRLSLQASGRPMARSVLTAAFMSGVLTVGLLACVLELSGLWQKFAFRDGGGALGLATRYWPCLLALAIAWGIWSVLFFAYWRQGEHYTWVGRVLRGLVAGSILELLVAAPVHALVLRRERENCYCAVGSYTGLVLGGTVLLWCFGPGVALLFLRERERRTGLTGAPPPRERNT
jgi:hypothetical protein